jgi:Zn-dependent M28 family amino/carboxypeptidase
MKFLLMAALALLTSSSAPGETPHMEGIKKNLISHVKYLSSDIGQRSYLDIEKLNKTADYIEEKFLSYGCDVWRQPFTYRGNTYENIICEIKGKEPGLPSLVVGAHYDTVAGTPGADDNASGIAGLLELARMTALNPMRTTVHFAAFSLEEPPVFMSSRMGSHIYAKSLKEEGARLCGMVSLEMLGYYCDRKGCQYYPLPFLRYFYPDRGDFISFVGNISSRTFTKKIKDSFKSYSILPVVSLNTLSIVPGVDFSDHRSFWKFGYPAFMITDTAFYRNPNYHGAGDTPETLDYDRMAELINGLYKALNLFTTL